MVKIGFTKKFDNLKAISFFCSLLFCLYIATLSQVDILPWFDRYNEKRILELFLLLLVAFLFLSNSSSRNYWLSTLNYLPIGSRMLLAGIVTLGFLSSARALFPKYAVLEVSTFILLFAVSICLACSRQILGKRFDKMVAIALFIIGWSYLTGFFGYYYTAVSDYAPLTRPDLFGNFSNIRFFNQLQSWTLSLMVLPLLLLTRRSIIITGIFAAVAMGWWLLLFASNCRGTLLGCIIAFPITLLLFRKQSKIWAKWQFISIAGGLAAYLLFFIVIPNALNIEVKTVLAKQLAKDDNARIELWTVAGQMVQAQPLVGTGPMHYAAEAQEIANHPHNSLLQIAAEWGAPVAFFVIILFIWGIIAWIRSTISFSTTENNNNVHAALLASLLTATVHSLVSGIIVMPLSQVMMVIVVGWMLGISIDRAAAKKKQSKLKHIVLFFCFFLTLYGALGTLFPEVLYLDKLQSEYMKSHPEQKHFKPRFWQHGNLPLRPDG